MEDKSFNYSLLQIANWTKGDSEVTIPALQRGLVWKPNQVELLWDSILRGFPIGSFLLSDIDDDNGNANAKYYLMDGQQRYNAISIGYNTVPNARAILWVDLLPPDSKSTRKYWIKATTIPHPWGFNNDDEASRLNTDQKRKALDNFNLKGSIYNNSFSLKDTWPINSNCPFPLYCFLNASTENPDTFIAEALDSLKKSDLAYKDKIVLTEEGKKYVKECLFPAFKSLQNYRINCNHLSKDVIVSESDTIGDEDKDKTALEVLFTRLNVGGTTISKEDLNYSAIKAYWPSIKDINDTLAQKYMNPSTLVMLAFRLALTKEEDKSIKNELTIKQIRNIAKKDGKEVKDITNLYENFLEKILSRVDEWLGVCDDTDYKTPSLLRTIIARNSPEVFLLLMYFAYKDIQSPINLTAKEVKALAFCLHWFGNDKKACAQEIFSRCRDGISTRNIQAGLSRLMHDCKMLHIYSPSEIGDLVSINDSEKWRIWQTLPMGTHEFFNRVFLYWTVEAKEMLLFAQRQYLNSHFANYDPARQDMWAEYNRPWDFDHIVPQDWINNKRGDYRDYDKDWLNSIGNIAAISYEANRSKSNGKNYNEYHNNEDSLMYDYRVEELQQNITYDKYQSATFARISFERFQKIYHSVYDVVEILVGKTILSNTLQKRKDLFLEIMKRLPNAVSFFAASNNKDQVFSREQDWAREWIGVGVVINDYCVCYEWDARLKDGKPYNVELGIRKKPESHITKENLDIVSNLNIDGYEKYTDNEWWYYWKNASDILQIDNIIDNMNFLINILKKHIIH